MLSIIPAAEYVRMSTDHQEFSTSNQSRVIREYAEEHGFTVIRTYRDLGKTGLLLKERPGLQELLADVTRGHANFSAILVYDVSRWGRFQDTDEAAYYEFVCKMAGVSVHYCAEPFVNNSDAANSILKALKRSMAAEYSRELARKVFDGQRTLASLGFRVGGRAGYGFRRLLVSANREPKQTLRPREYKSVSTDRVILIPGPKSETDVVRKIFKMAETKDPPEIAAWLNKHGILHDGGTWTRTIVRAMIFNPKYAGDNAWARTSTKLHTASVSVNPCDWVIKRGAFQPLVSIQVAEAARAALTRRDRSRFDYDRIVADLRKALRHKESISLETLRSAKGVKGRTSLYKYARSITDVYSALGYDCSLRYVQAAKRRRFVHVLRRTLLKDLVAASTNVSTFTPPGKKRIMLRLGNGALVSVIICPRYRYTPTSETRVLYTPVAHESGNITLVATLDRTNVFIDELILFKENNRQREARLAEDDAWLNSGLKLKHLPDFEEQAMTLASSRGL